MFLADKLTNLFRIAFMVFYAGNVHYNAVLVSNTLMLDFFMKNHRLFARGLGLEFVDKILVRLLSSIRYWDFMNTLNIHLFYLSHRPKMVDVLHHHLARMYGSFVFNLIYCRLPSPIAGREDFSTERGIFFLFFTFSFFWFLFIKKGFSIFIPFFFFRYSYPILDYPNNALASDCWWNVSLWFPLWWNNYGISTLFFYSKIFVIIFTLSLIFKSFLLFSFYSFPYFILFFRLSLRTSKIFNRPCQIPCLDRFCKICSQLLLLEPLPI